MPRVLIIGFGRMGRVHAKHLTDLGVAWDYFDPFVAGGIRDIGERAYTHAIIATPINSHFESYCAISHFSGPILIEKPVVVRPEHLTVFDDPRIVPGMVERFNPAVEALKISLNNSQIVSLSFHRTSITGAVDDIGIHDLDLFTYLVKDLSSWDLRWEDHTFIIQTRSVQARFAWRRSSVRQTLVECTTSRGRIIADLHTQAIDGAPLPHRWPVEAELRSFLDGKTVDAKTSHQLLIDCLRLRGESAANERCSPAQA